MNLIGAKIQSNRSKEIYSIYKYMKGYYFGRSHDKIKAFIPSFLNQLIKYYPESFGNWKLIEKSSTINIF